MAASGLWPATPSLSLYGMPAGLPNGRICKNEAGVSFPHPVPLKGGWYKADQSKHAGKPFGEEFVSPFLVQIDPLFSRAHSHRLNKLLPLKILVRITRLNAVWKNVSNPFSIKAFPNFKAEKMEGICEGKHRKSRRYL